MIHVKGLDARLSTIAKLVRSGARLADVGCDHGYLICALAQQGSITSGIACDINEKPLDKARQLIALGNFSDRLSCRLGDGLQIIAPDEVDDVVIAGMGGEMIVHILERSGWESFAEKNLILQPMSRTSFLRRWLYAHGFSILQERACLSAHRPYTVMQVQYTGVRKQLGELDLYTHVGELLYDNSEAARRYLLRVSIMLRKQGEGLAAVDPIRAAALESLYHKLVTVIEEVHEWHSTV